MNHGSTLLPIICALLQSLHRHSFIAQGPPSHHPSSLSSVFLVPALHLLPPSTPFWPYGTHPFFTHALTISILSDLLYSLTPFLFQLALLRTTSFITLSNRWHSNQSSQTLHLKSIHFSSLRTFYIPCLSSVQRHWYHYSFIYVDTSWLLSQILYCSAHTLKRSPRSLPLIHSVYHTSLSHPPSAATCYPRS